MAVEYRTEPDYIEYLDGEAHPKVSPRNAHGRVQLQLGSILIACGARRYGSVATEADAVVSKRTKLIPDVSFVTFEQERSVSGPQAEEPPYAPAIAIEVWSRGDSEDYLQRKFARYLSEGSQLVLDVRIETRTILAHTAMGVRTYSEHETFECEAFPWFTFPVRDVFSVLRQAQDDSDRVKMTVTGDR
jgi:Uma2 family endonuclease